MKYYTCYNIIIVVITIIIIIIIIVIIIIIILNFIIYNLHQKIYSRAFWPCSIMLLNTCFLDMEANIPKWLFLHFRVHINTFVVKESGLSPLVK